MAEKPKRKRRRVLSDEVARRGVSSEEKSSRETCEEELFRFTNKRTSLEDLEEETLKQIQEELYEDCRHEDEYHEEDRRKWPRKTDYRAWKVVDKQSNDARRNNPQDQQHKNKAQGEKQDDDDDSSDDDYPDDNCNYIPSHYVPPSMPSSQALLNNVTMRLHSLRSNKVATPTGANDSIIDCTTPSPSHDTNYHITLRIRCKGRTHRYNTLTVKPFSDVVAQLADELGVAKERILLSYKEDDVPLNATPDSLGLTTVDFLDALVLEKAITDEPVLPENDREQITVRVQSSTKSVSYRLCKTDRLDKVLAAFSSAVEFPQEQIKFEFDGDPVLPDSTAETLGLEDDDIIDARITSN